MKSKFNASNVYNHWNFVAIVYTVITVSKSKDGVNCSKPRAEKLDRNAISSEFQYSLVVNHDDDAMC